MTSSTNTEKHGPSVGEMWESTKNVLNKKWNEIVKIVNQDTPPRCVNGRLSADTRSCDCHPHYYGHECEFIQCLNGGHNVTLLGKLMCKCAPAEYVSGVHCESVACGNGGVLLPDKMSCQCPSYWYRGTYCEEWIVSTYAPIAIPACAAFLALLFCFICRMDLCPRGRRTERSARSHHSVPSSQSGRGAREREGRGQPDTLLPLNAPHGQVVTARVGDDSNAFHIRLDTIPTFNPNMIGGVPIEDDKQLDAPPPYEEALNAPLQPPLQRPPRYEESVPSLPPLATLPTSSSYHSVAPTSSQQQQQGR